MTTQTSSLFLCVLAARLVVINCARGECLDVLTSEGLRTLQHGERACAILDRGETSPGARFLTCNHGSVIVTRCNSSLRFDIVTGVCNWPDFATCRTGNVAGQPSGSELFVSSTSASPPTTTPTEAPSTAATSTAAPATTTRSPSTTTTGSPSTTTTMSPSTTTVRTTSTTKVPPSNTTRAPPVGPCSPDNCPLPDCFCYGSQPSIPVPDTPQFIMMTFDDAVTPQAYESFFRQLLTDNVHKIFNPSGCPISAAFYLSHENTDYSKVLELWQAGNEIASHTVHHSLPTGDVDSDYPEMAAEIDGLRQEVFKALGNKALADSIKGFRAPYLRVAHNVQFDVLRDYSFLYDTSVTSVEIWSGKSPIWPYTLDFVVNECNNSPCPTKSYRGLWEVIMNSWLGDNGFPCSMLDMCSVGENLFTASQAEWESLYDKNLAHFSKSKVPMPYFTHASMFQRSPNSYPALISWLKRLQAQRSDVWLVSPLQVLQWMKKPLTNAEMIAKKWGC